MYICTHIYIYIYTHVHVCVSLSLSLCVYIYIYIYMHTWWYVWMPLTWGRSLLSCMQPLAQIQLSSFESRCSYPGVAALILTLTCPANGLRAQGAGPIFPTLRGGEGTVDWDSAASNCSTGSCLHNFNKKISSKNSNWEIWARWGFQPYHPPFRHMRLLRDVEPQAPQVLEFIHLS